jgi:hypothetical protein
MAPVAAARNRPAAAAAFTTPRFLTGECKTSVFSHSPRPKSAPSKHTEAASQFPSQITCELRSTQNEAHRNTVCFRGPKTKHEAQSPKHNEAQRSTTKHEAHRSTLPTHNEAHSKWPAKRSTRSIVLPRACFVCIVHKSVLRALRSANYGHASDLRVMLQT